MKQTVLDRKAPSASRRGSSQSPAFPAFIRRSSDCRGGPQSLRFGMASRVGCRLHAHSLVGLMSPKRWIVSFVVLVLAASGVKAAENRGPVGPSAVALVETIAERHALPLAGVWEVPMPQQVVDTGADGAAVTATLHALRNGSDIAALLLVQRNVLPSATGWGAPAACDGGTTNPGVTVYRSPRDVLCGWARTVSFSSSPRRAKIGAITAMWLGGDASRFGSRTNTWLWLGLRVSNRSDFLDVQLLVPNNPAIPRATAEQFLADMAHSMDATWLTASLAAVPAPPVAKPPPEPTGPWWSGTLSASAMKTMTYRAGVSIKTFLVASLMAGDAATGGAIIVVLNVTSTTVYLVNDYLWETWYPLAQPAQDFVPLVDTS